MIPAVLKLPLEIKKMINLCVGRKKGRKEVPEGENLARSTAMGDVCMSSTLTYQIHQNLREVKAWTGV